MFRRTGLACCFTAIASVLALALPATTAVADVNQCAPITIDGAEVACLELTAAPTTQPNGDPAIQLTMTLEITGEAPVTETETATIPLSVVNSALGNFCVSNNQHLMAWSRVDAQSTGQEFGIGVTDPAFPGRCFGKLGFTLMNLPPSITPPGVGGVTTIQPLSEPYHVPLVCVTTSPGVCIGPYDGVLEPQVPFPVFTSPLKVQDANEAICVGSPPGFASPSGAPGAFELLNSFDPEFGTNGWFDDGHCVPV